MRRSLTLIELLLSMSLLATIVFAAAGIDLAARNFFKASDYRVEVINDLSLIFDHIHRHASKVQGWTDDVGYQVPSNTSLRLRLDSGTPSDFGDDTTVEYQFNSADNTLVFCDNFVVGSGCTGSSEILSSKIVPNASGAPFFSLSGSNATISLDISGRYSPTESANIRKNPEVNLKSTVFFAEHSFD